jgi:hypothetical protein
MKAATMKEMPAVRESFFFILHPSSLLYAKL